MIRSEYLRFLHILTKNDVSADVRKVANIVLSNLDTLIPLSTSQWQRIKKIVELTQMSWETTLSDIQVEHQEVIEQNYPVTKLKSLTVGPFRGFSKSEEFDLASELVLIYGPNGTGKSSFCEALEYGLLGNVAEAESKRFRSQQEYLKNAFTNNFIPPTLIGFDSVGNNTLITENEALYRFCFVDKNRIDNFARIAAQAPSKQTELISTLFGLDAFTDFVRNFTDTMDSRYIDIEGVKTKELTKKRETLTGFQQQLKTTIPDEFQSIDKEEKEIVKEYRENCTFTKMVAEINGIEGNDGLIKQLEEELQKQLPIKSNLTIADLETLKLTIESYVIELESKQDTLSKDSLKISFKQLYQAVKDLEKNSSEQCPACQTPIFQVKVNPFDSAKAELIKLENLGELQETVKSLESDINISLVKLSDIINNCYSQFSGNNQLSAFQNKSSDKTMIEWWISLHQQLSDGFTPWVHLKTQVKQLEDIDKKTETAKAEQTQKQNELKRLREFSERIIKLQTRREIIKGTKKKAEEAIKKFDTENAQLIKEVEAEKTVVMQNNSIANAYTIFVSKLNIYKNDLPSQLVSNLGEMVILLYNAFNRYDPQHEQLASIRLPLIQNQRLEIAFKNSPNTYYDALHILSEGHIRCVGLAIMTAKNIKENSPLLIFDDPINAIDDEHRQAIRETLFVDDFFKEKQLIIAVHGEEFFNRTHQVIGKDAAQRAFSYLFSPKEDCHIQVNLLNRPKNYVLAARELYNTGEYRDSLMSSRRAFEYLADLTWYHYGKYSDKSDGLISVSRRSPNQPWDLRCLAENLKSKFNKSKADIPNKDNIISAFTSLLGIDANQPPWTYLNKGTHDQPDLPEFEQPIVDQIIIALEQLDLLLKDIK